MRYYPLIILLIAKFGFAQNEQKIYSFDHILEYRYQLNDKTAEEKMYILTNSRANNYKLTVFKKDSLYELKFIDEDGIYAHFLLTKNDFYQAETFGLGCEIVTRYKNPYIYKRKQYEYLTAKDSVIDTAVYHSYILKNKKEKRERNLNLPRIRYVMEEETAYHLPVFIHAIAYEEWKKEKTLPNGIPKLMYCFKNDQEKFHIYKLVNILKTEKYLSFDKDCKRLRSSSLPPIFDFQR